MKSELIRGWTSRLGGVRQRPSWRRIGFSIAMIIVAATAVSAFWYYERVFRLEQAAALDRARAAAVEARIRAKYCGEEAQHRSPEILKFCAYPR